MRDEDDGRVSGMTPDEIEADMLAKPEALAVTYVPTMTPEQLALYEAQVRSTQTGVHDGPSPGGVDTGHAAGCVTGDAVPARGMGQRPAPRHRGARHGEQHDAP